MKRQFKSSLFIAALFGLSSIASAAVLIDDSFTYTDGNLVGNDPAIGGACGEHSGAGAVPVQVSGGQISIAQGAGSREDVNSVYEGGFVAGAGTKLYSAYDLTVNDPGAAITSAYFSHFMQGTTIFPARVWVTTPTTSGYRLAISMDGDLTDTTEGFTGDLSFGTTYRVVTLYDYDAQDGTLWIDPVSEASPSVTATDTTFSDEVTSYAFRQTTGNSIQIID